MTTRRAIIGQPGKIVVTTRSGTTRAVLLLGLLAIAGCDEPYETPAAPVMQDASAATAPRSYPNMPAIGTPNVRVESYAPVPSASKGPPVDPQKGYVVELIRNGVYWVTEGAYQSMFVVTTSGVVVVDAPPTIGAKLLDAIASVTTLPITHVVYSHAHIDHIGSADLLPTSAVVIAHEHTAELLKRAKDPHRPLPTVTFPENFVLETGGKKLELIDPGPGHEEGNLIIYLPDDEIAMLVDVVYPGWMPWRSIGIAKDIPGLFTTIDRLLELRFDTVVTGHVARLGNRKDVEEAREFLVDLRAAAGAGLQTVSTADVAADLSEENRGNPWAFFRGYIDRVVIHCVNQMTPKWSTRLAAYDVWIYDQCIAMEQSLRVD